MAMTIESTRVPTLTLERDPETGRMKIQGRYELMSSTGIALAKQSFGNTSYVDMKYEPSPETQAQMSALKEQIQNDINKILGF